MTNEKSSSNLKWTIEGALVNRPAETRWCSLGTREPDLDNASVGRVHFLIEFHHLGITDTRVFFICADAQRIKCTLNNQVQHMKGEFI